MYFVYVLFSRRYRKTYTGITGNLFRRLKQHNQGVNTYTKRYRPWTIAYSEKCEDRTIARRRERYLKSAAGRKWMTKILFKKKNLAEVAELADAQS